MANQPPPDPASATPDSDAARESALIEAARRQALGRTGQPWEASPGVASPDGPEGPPTIGRYRIQRRIGVGGMGTVFEAVQDAPQRTVAVKVLHAGTMNARAMRRFELETHVLARLQHPGIAQIYEAGVFETPSGPHPYFAMEFVEGRQLRQHADSLRLSAHQRLELIARVCDAVQHAHVKGVIHRDLKPANILVTRDGAPKVLDFGVARATGLDLSTITLRSRHGEPVGTVPYMSPEQAAGVPEDIDTRSDIYALGVICYELLAGRHPLPLAGVPLSRALHVIAEHQPTALSAIDRTFRGDVETMVAKAMDKDRERRYQSAADFAADIRRYLRGEPIQARPVGRVERLWRWCRREPRIAALTASLLLLLVALAVGSTWASLKIAAARRAEQRALQRSEGVSEQRRRDLYTSQMALAMQAFEQRDTPAVLRLLEAQRPLAGQADLRGFEWNYLWRQLHGDRQPLGGHNASVVSLAISPDGRWAASGGADGAICLWDAAAWKRRAIFAAHVGPVHAVAFRPGGSILATGGADGFVRLWEVPTGRLVRSVSGGSGPIQCLAFEDHGQRLAWGGGTINRMVPRMQDRPGEIHLWNPDADQESCRVAVLYDPVVQLAFLPQRPELMAVTWGAVVRRWRIEDLAPIETPEPSVAGSMALAVSPDGSRAAVGVRGGELAVCDTGSWVVERRIPVTNAAAVAFSPDGQILAVANTDDGSVSLWDAETGRDIDLLRGHCSHVSALAFSAAKNELVSAGSDGTLKVWDLDRCHRGLRIAAPEKEIADLAFTPDGTRLLTAGRDGTVRVWDAQRGQPLAQFGSGRDWCESLAMFSGGRTLAFSQRTLVQVLDIDSKQGVMLGGFPGVVHAVAASPDGRYLAVGGAATLVPDRCGLRVFATDDWHSCWSRRFAGQEVRALAFSPDATRLAAGGTQGDVWLLDAADGSELACWPHTGWIETLAFSPDGRHLAAGSWPQDQPLAEPVTVRVWGVAGGGIRYDLPGHRHAACSLAFSPDGALLASGGGNGVVRLWDLAEGTLRATFRMPHDGWVLGLAFSPSGRRLACTSATATEAGQVVMLETDEEPKVSAAAPPTDVEPPTDSSAEGQPLWNSPQQQLVVLTGSDSAQPRVFTTRPPESRSFLRTIAGPRGGPHQAVAVYCYRAWDIVSEPAHTALGEYPLQLPPNSSAQLRVTLAFENPWGKDEQLAGDVNWFVRVRPGDSPAGELGQIVFHAHSQRSIWQPAIVDLSDFAGQRIWLQLVVPPDRGANRVYWVEPVLSLDEKD